MALANYTDLKAAVASWLNRSDLTTPIVDFIALAETRFNRKLRARQMETRLTLTLGDEYQPVPADWLEFRSGYTNTDPRRRVELLSPELQTTSHSSTDPGIQFVSIAGGYFRFDPATVDGDATILYYAKIPPLALNATNWLLTDYPDAYLAGAITAASAYIQNDERLPMMKALYDEVVQEINATSRAARASGPLVARPG